MKCILGICASVILTSSIPGAFSAETQFTRMFTVSRDVILAKLSEKQNPGEVDFNTAIRSTLTDAGINLSTNKGEGFFYNTRTGVLMVHGTRSNFDAIEKLLQNTKIPATVKLEIRVAEIPETNDILVEIRASEQLRRSDHLARSDSVAGAHIMTEAEFTEMLARLEKTVGVDLLSFPTVSAVSGRNVRIEFASEEPVFDPPFHAPGKR